MTDFSQRNSIQIFLFPLKRHNSYCENIILIINKDHICLIIEHLIITNIQNICNRFVREDTILVLL